MSKKFMVLSLLAVIASFAGGFLLANAFNRSELITLRTENERLKAAAAESPGPSIEPSLDDSEIRAKIVEADRNAGNFDFQKNLGQALYKYASMKRDTGLLKESVRILERAADLRKNDNEVIVGLGNAHFDLGYFGKDNAELLRARDLYARALAIRPNDAEVRTDLGLTFFLVDPPDDPGAIAEFQRSLKINPKGQKTLEFLIQSLLRANNITDAEKYLSQLRAVDTSNETVAALALKIEDAKSRQPK